MEGKKNMAREGSRKEGLTGIVLGGVLPGA